MRRFVANVRQSRLRTPLAVQRASPEAGLAALPEHLVEVGEDLP